MDILFLVGRAQSSDEVDHMLVLEPYLVVDIVDNKVDSRDRVAQRLPYHPPVE